MAEEHLEVERKFDVGESFAVPDLTGLPGVASVDAPVEHHLEAAYFDTADLRLARGRVTLRRRTGGTDAGWHLKLPVEGARREIRQPLGRAVKNPPRALATPITGILRGAAVDRVATLQTRRVATVLRDAEGRALVEVADDTVTATALATDLAGAAEILRWREVEAELVEGDEALLGAVEEALLGAGARPAAAASKLARVLADRLTAVNGGPPQAVPGTKSAKKATGKAIRKAAKKKGPRQTAAEVVLTAVRAQVEALQQADLMLRTDQPDAVHKLRVAGRRLRSILAAFRPVLDRGRTEPLREELKWLGTELSDARDGEVALEHLREVVAAQPEELVLGPVAARLQQTEIREVQEGTARALATLDHPRYLGLLDALYGLLDDPPLAAHAKDPARRALHDAIRRTGRRLRHRMDVARQATGPERSHAVHEVRKAAKRVRYTAEVAAPVLGPPATALVDCMEHVQEVLGGSQDTVVTREYCRRLGLAASAAGENGWTWGRLYALEEARAERAQAEFWELASSLGPIVTAATKKS
jgi:CHAD domain-containing protein